MKLTVFVAAALLAATAFTFGDVAPDPLVTGGAGLTAKDAKDITVAMTEEVVDLTPSAEKNVVTAVFTLKNNSDAPAKLEVGFPDYFKMSLQDFAVEIDGQKQLAEVKKESHSDGGHKILFEYWMCWPMTFEKNQERTVNVSYWVKTEASRTGLWQERLPDDLKAKVSTFESGYVLRTGAAWAGNIGKATINIHYSKDLKKSQMISTNPKNGWKYDAASDTDTLVAKDFEPVASDYDLPVSVRSSGGVTATAEKPKPGAIGDISYTFRLSSEKEIASLLETAIKEQKLDPWAMEYLLDAVEKKNVLNLPKEEQAQRVAAILEWTVPPLGPTFKQQVAEGANSYKDHTIISAGAEAILEKLYDRVAKHYDATHQAEKSLALAKARQQFFKNIVDREAFYFDSGRWPKKGSLWGQYQSHRATYKGICEDVARREAAPASVPATGQ